MPRLDVECYNYFKLMHWVAMGVSGSHGGEVIPQL